MTPTKKQGPGEEQRAAIVLKMLTEYFGSAREAFRFARAFAGVQLTLPRLRMVERLHQRHQVLDALNRDPSTAAVRRVAEMQGRDLRRVAKDFSRDSGKGLKQVRIEQSARHERNAREIAEM